MPKAKGKTYRPKKKKKTQEAATRDKITGADFKGLKRGKGKK